jgi:hypothetical protein
MELKEAIIEKEQNKKMHKKLLEIRKEIEIIEQYK